MIKYYKIVEADNENAVWYSEIFGLRNAKAALERIKRQWHYEIDRGEVNPVILETTRPYIRDKKIGTKRRMITIAKEWDHQYGNGWKRYKVECSRCGQVFSYGGWTAEKDVKDDFRAHRCDISLAPHKCEYCGTTVPTSYALEEHYEHCSALSQRLLEG